MKRKIYNGVLYVYGHFFASTKTALYSFVLIGSQCLIFCANNLTYIILQVCHLFKVT